ncbi:hypothetical protein NDU88_002605 [Pleurodeles waltl]|uniref:Uncharacterized protein n=1 Tax=Pleurodeles waltl TaxID=8319 RepID=A0AAV7UAC3_PLEWA|nr:hypothetical protein NDU88_002605 [Pleurodeles waltl]
MVRQNDYGGSELDSDLVEMVNRGRNVVASHGTDWLNQQMQGVLQQESTMSQKGAGGGGAGKGKNKKTQRWGVASERPVAVIMDRAGKPTGKQRARAQARRKSPSLSISGEEESECEEDSEHERREAPVAIAAPRFSASGDSTERARESGEAQVQCSTGGGHLGNNTPHPRPANLWEYCELWHAVWSS